MFKKEVIEIDGKEVFFINGVKMRYDTNQIDDTKEDVQERLSEMADGYKHPAPFSIRKDDQVGVLITTNRLKFDIIPVTFYYGGYWFNYDPSELTADVDFTYKDLQAWLKLYRDWIIDIVVVKGGGWNVVTRP